MGKWCGCKAAIGVMMMMWKRRKRIEVGKSASLLLHAWLAGRKEGKKT